MKSGAEHFDSVDRELKKNEKSKCKERILILYC